MRQILLAAGCCMAFAMPGLAWAQDSSAPASPTPGYTTTTVPQTPGEAPVGGKTHGGGGGKFDAANTTHDGHLTEAQAEAGHMHGIVKHFSEIDVDHKGYITKEDIRAWHQKTKGDSGGGTARPG